MIYETVAKGKLTPAFEGETASADAKAAAARVVISGTSITIDLGKQWGRNRTDVGRSVVIVFSDVQAGLVAAGNMFRSSASARGGNLRLLAAAASPAVTVGNILASRTPAAVIAETTGAKVIHADPLSRSVEITPTKVYPGEKKQRFTITFKAPGPMDGSVLSIEIPESLRPDGDPSTPAIDGFATANLAAMGISVLGRGGAKLVAGTADDPNPSIALGGDNDLVINIATIKADQTVVVTYTIDIPALAVPTQAELTAAPTDADGNVTSHFTATTDIDGEGTDDTGTDVTSITGGLIGMAAGSGRMQISPVSIEDSQPSRTFTLTYTAYTALDNANIMITPDGIVLEDDPGTENVTEELQVTSSGSYGYVIGSASPSGNSKGTLDAAMLASGVIEWEGVTLAKNAKLITTVRRVHVTEDAADNYEWVTTVDSIPVMDDTTTEDINEVATLTVVNSDRDAVKFEVVGDGMYSAASKTSIQFRFTAEATPIRDGSVSFVVPSALGSAPAASDAEDTAGTVDVSIDGGKLKGAKKVDQIKVSGRTITVHIERLDITGSVTVTYGKGAAKSATVVAAKAGDVKVIGNYRTSTGTRPAGIATVKILNVADGAAGTVTISPQQVEAGSNHGVVSIKFTALGTMDGGQVSLELPGSGWGTFQRDPAQRNYIQVSGNSSVALTEPTVGETGSKAVAKITKLAAGQSFTFVYGRGSGGSANGAEVQDSIGVATFTIESDGDGDDLFAAVKAKRNRPTPRRL